MPIGENFVVFALPSLIAGLLFLVFTYLYEQSHANRKSVV